MLKGREALGAAADLIALECLAMNLDTMKIETEDWCVPASCLSMTEFQLLQLEQETGTGEAQKKIATLTNPFNHLR